ncbi:hypothetical protein PoB_000618200 [Plakobranchus ocellatus]|uniref:Uncharacterized protein n=1 Tax=Plakobranchus ocellatus TaxID=259542 RepID=A0AAV3YB63_9GAST|nr:hypothetical protein PoB_000618200 [Plakobranchus ocellatus]
MTGVQGMDIVFCYQTILITLAIGGFGLCVWSAHNKVISGFLALSGQGAGCDTRTRDRRVPAELRTDSYPLCHRLSRNWRRRWWLND